MEQLSLFNTNNIPSNAVIDIPKPKSRKHKTIEATSSKLGNIEYRENTERIQRIL